MKRLSIPLLALLLAAPTAYSESDDELLDTVYANFVSVYLADAASTLPESFLNSGLDPTDKQQLIEKWANDSAQCHVDTLSTFAQTNKVALSEMVADDGTYGLRNGVLAEYEEQLSSCLMEAWEAIGAAYPG